MFNEMQVGGIGGGGQSDSGSQTLSGGTDTTITLSFTPKIIFCKFIYSASDYVLAVYNADVESSKEFSLLASVNSRRIDTLPFSGDGLGGAIQSVASNGFTVRANSSYANFEWWAYE